MLTIRSVVFFVLGILIHAPLEPASAVPQSTLAVSQDRSDQQSVASAAPDKSVPELLSELEQATSPEKRDALIEALSDKGPAIRPGLKRAAKDRKNSPEFRRRLQLVIAAIARKERRDALQAHVAGKPVPAKFKFPGWKRFSEILGQDSDTQAFYLAMSSSEHDLLAYLEEEPARIADHLRLLISGDGDLQGQPSVDPVLDGYWAAAILLVVGDERTAQDAKAQHEVVKVLSDPRFEPALQKDPRLVKLLRAWLLNPLPPGEWTSAHNEMTRAKLTSAAKYQLKNEERQLVKTGLAGSKEQQIEMLRTLTYGNNIDPSFCLLVEPFLKDDSVCATLGWGTYQGKSYQVRDLALMALFKLSGKKHTDFGYVPLAPEGDQQADLVIFEDDQARQAVIKKWRDWSKEHLHPQDEQPSSGDK